MQMAPLRHRYLFQRYISLLSTSVRLNGSSVTRMSIRTPILLVTASIWPRVASLFKADLQRTDELSCKDNINGEPEGMFLRTLFTEWRTRY